MRGNTFGQFFTVTTFGESHGPAMGAVVDGCPAGVPLLLQDFADDLARRRPGQSEVTTSRNEPDEPELLSGVYDGKTLGTPICVVVHNRDQRSQDYDADHFRAGHADRVWQEKFGHRDHRGGGRASGRETLSRVLGGTIAKKMLGASMTVTSFTRQIGTHVLEGDQFDVSEIEKSPVRLPSSALSDAIVETLLSCKEEGDSRGGVIETWIDGVPPGLGEPVFRKFKSELSSAHMSVGAVVGFSVGDAQLAANSNGKSFHTGVSGASPEAGVSSSAHGIQGGLTNGERVVVRTFFKPASTIGKKAQEGRHDPCIVPRAVPVLEAMTWLVLADFTLEARLNRWHQQ